MKLRKPLGTTVGAVALTIVAASSALAVNAGILRHRTDTTVGTLDATVTTEVVDAPTASDVRYVITYVDDPAPTASLTTGAPAQAVAPTSAVTVASQPVVDSHDDDAYENEYEGADDDD